MPKDNKTDSYTPDEIPSPNFFCCDFYQKRKRGKYRLSFAPDTSYAVADTHCHLEMSDKPEWQLIRCALHNVSFLACVVDSTDDGQEALKLIDEAYVKAQEMLPSVIDKVKEEGRQETDQVIIHGEDEKPQFCLDLNSVVDKPKIPDLRYIIGTHPHHSKSWNSTQEKNLYEMLKHKKATCVGEIGLDYHYNLSPRKDQIEVFKIQLKIAKKLNLPVSLHLREAHNDALKIFDELGFGDNATLLHCFNLGPKELKPWVDAGCFVALGGPITFKKSDETREAVKLIPKDKILSETDAPFMTPEPLRGDTCFPDHVIYNAQKIFECSGCDNKSEFYKQMLNNAYTLLGN